MLIADMHHWLGHASGGAGPIFRWVWGLLIAMCTGGILYLGVQAFH
jgi:hypothetical protein